jgi:hypothetical protein
MSECDAECKLCGPLGCLRPHRITFPELLKELDRAALACAATIVFPPNFLNHPEAAQFCFETSRRGLTPLVRVRPSQLVTMNELLSTLEYRRAEFEVIVAEAIPLKAISSRLQFKTVFIPSKLIDPVLLFDSIPFPWRKGLEVLAPFASTFEHALSADEIYLFTRNRHVTPYAQGGRQTIGTIPGARDTVVIESDETNEIRFSVIVAAHHDLDVSKILEALDAQSMESKFFEVIVVCDRVSDEFIESLKFKSNAQVIRLADCWGVPAFRLARAFNAGAASARGARLLFLSENFPIERELLARCAQRPEPFVKLDSRAVDQPSRRAHLMTIHSYFELGGYPEAENNGFEFDMMEHKASPTAWVLGDVDKAEAPVRAIAPKASPMRVRAAQDFYFMTLDQDFYRSHFAIMGSRAFLRRAFSWLRIFKPLVSVFAKERARAEIARAMKVVRA